MPSKLQSLLRRWKRGRASSEQLDSTPESIPTSSGNNRLQSDTGAETAASSPKKGELGLALLYEPHATSDDNRRAAVDIIFVHGLNGDILETWTHSNGKCWPRDLLPNAMPGARIFSYGYDSKVFFSASQAEYRDFALGLVRDLYYLEHNTGAAQPIIFVCHSLGGIVVKEAINIAADREWSLELRNRCKGIVFLGTPHRGSGAAGPATLLSNVFEAVWSPVGLATQGLRKKLVSDLRRNSKVLFAISDRFLGKANTLNLVSIYETAQMFPLGDVVVDEHSAVLGLPHERRWPMFANHCDLCRFENERSRDYQTVLNAILELMESILPTRKGSESERLLTNSEQACIQQLDAVDIIEFESQIDERLPNTLSWLPEDSHYRQWLSKTSVRLLLVTGYAGCGKTVLSSYLRTILSNSLLPTSLICRFYCDAKAKDRSNAVVLMRSMICQTVQYSHQALQATVKASKDDQRLWGSFERLWTLFESIAASNGIAKIIIIIDAIDELEDGIQKQMSARILHLLQSETSSTVKFVITSQPHAFAVRELRRHSTHLALETKQDVIGEDVNLYIQDRLANIQLQKGWSDGMRQRLTDVLQSKADRSFLWVSFTLSYLERRDILANADLEDALLQIPPDLTNFYNRFLTSIMSRDAPGPALRLLNMLLSSSRPLHVSELAILLSINRSHQSITGVQRDSAIKGIQSIQHTLGPLIKSHNSKIQLVHTTLKDHLTAFGSDFGIIETEGHELLAEKCILYLLLQHQRQNSVESIAQSTPLTSPAVISLSKDSELLEEASIDNPESIFGTIFEEPRTLGDSGIRYSGAGNELYDYAIRFWATHFQQCHPSEGSSLYTIGTEVYNRISQTRWSDYLRIVADESLEYPVKPDMLTVACFYGHETLLTHFLKQSNVSDVQIGQAFFWASAKGRTDCIKILYSYLDAKFTRSFSNVSGRNPVAAAAEYGHVESLDFLLKTHAFDVNHQDGSGNTAFSLAAANAQDHVISLLLALEQPQEAMVNLPDLNGRSALFWACRANSANVVSKLLNDERTEPNLLDRHSCDALSWACSDGLANIVRLFVDNPRVILSNQDGRGNTPLIYAVKSKDLPTVTALFRRSRSSRFSGTAADMNISARDKEGRNAVSWAASTAEPRILEFLLRHGSDEANVPDKSGWTPLAWTMNPPGYPQNAIQLLQCCGDLINDKDDKNSSLLSTAIFWGAFDVARILIERTNIDIHWQSSSGRTALSLAASSGSLETVKLMIEIRSANPSIADNAGRLPWQWARETGYTEIAQYLEGLADVTYAEETET